MLLEINITVIYTRTLSADSKWWDDLAAKAINNRWAVTKDKTLWIRIKYASDNNF